MSILFRGESRSFEYKYTGGEPTFHRLAGRGVLLFSALDTREEAIIAGHLDAMGIPTAILPMPLAPETVHLSIGEKPSLRIGGRPVPLRQIGAVWLLCGMERRIRDGQHAAEYAFSVDEWRTVLGMLCAEISAFWVNAPASSGFSRLAALKLAESFGLLVPTTIVTNDAKEALAFCRRAGPCVVKRAGHSFPNLPSGEIYPVFTRRLSPTDLDDGRLADCPVLIQTEISKRCEYRVYVIGSETVCFRLGVGDALDWREVGAFEIPREPIALNSSVVERLRRLVSTLGLSYAALDLIEDKRGNVYFLEVNANGTYEFCDTFVTPSIGERIARLLVSGLGG